MNKSTALIAVAAFAALASTAVRAESPAADSQYAASIDSNRTRAEVQAEAVVEAHTHSMEPAGSRVTTYQSTADRAAVRAQAAEAVRTGQIPMGELG